MEAILDTGFSLSYRDQVLHFLLPLFPRPEMDNQSSHLHSLTRLLVTLGNAPLTASLLVSMVPQEKLLAYQFAFDLVEGGAQDFLESVRNELPEGGEVNSLVLVFSYRVLDRMSTRKRKTFTTICGISSPVKSQSSSTSNFSSGTTKLICLSSKIPRWLPSRILVSDTVR